jgi:hypothetical protein
LNLIFTDFYNKWNCHNFLTLLLCDSSHFYLFRCSIGDVSSGSVGSAATCSHFHAELRLWWIRLLSLWDRPGRLSIVGGGQWWWGLSATATGSVVVCCQSPKRRGLAGPMAARGVLLQGLASSGGQLAETSAQGRGGAGDD